MKDALLIKQELDAAIPPVEDVPLDWAEVLGRSAQPEARSHRFRTAFVTRRIVVVAAALAVIAAGIFFGLSRTTGGTDLAAAAVRVKIGSRTTVINVVRAMQARAQNESTEVVGGSAGQQALMREILSKMPNNSLTRVAIVPLKSPTGTDGVGLEFDALSGDLPRSGWEESLVIGAFRALAAVRGLPPVVMARPPQPADYVPSIKDPASIEAEIRSASAAVDAEVVQIQIYQPYGTAPAVILKVHDPAPFLLDRALSFTKAIEQDEGSFVEVIDDSGAFVWMYSRNNLVSEGQTGTRPDLSGCNPIQVIGFGVTEPCPAP
jgi:hypothetical protein